MKEEITICVLCKDYADIVFNPKDNLTGLALCLNHARLFQRLVDHMGNFPVCQKEVIVDDR